jgi:hypothetical protein
MSANDVVGMTGATAKAATDVLRVRFQQVMDGHTPAVDDSHQFHELAEAAVAHIRVAIHQQRAGGLSAELVASHHWPFSHRPMRVLPTRQALVEAAALLLAEIERQDRLDAASPPLPST